MSGETDKAKGRVKQAAGDLSGDRELEREGEKDESAGKLKEAAGKAKDKFDDAIDSVKDRSK
ncbi:MAG TPA: CsbD family protein [Ilumatobacteraceae bacterium]|nr:CsbD family protein [Ilumatobacteraceae bacterium]